MFSTYPCINKFLFSLSHGFAQVTRGQIGYNSIDNACFSKFLEDSLSYSKILSFTRERFHCREIFLPSTWYLEVCCGMEIVAKIGIIHIGQRWFFIFFSCPIVSSHCLSIFKLYAKRTTSIIAFDRLTVKIIVDFSLFWWNLFSFL